MASVTNHGRAAGTLSKRRFTNVLKRWPLSGANEGNAAIGDGVTFDAGMALTLHTDGTLKKATGADREKVVVALDDYDAYDVVEAASCAYLEGSNYTFETSAIKAGGSWAIGDRVKAEANTGLYEEVAGGTTDDLKQQWRVDGTRTEVLSSGSSVTVLVLSPVIK